MSGDDLSRAVAHARKLALAAQQGVERFEMLSAGADAGAGASSVGGSATAERDAAAAITSVEATLRELEAANARVQTLWRATHGSGPTSGPHVQRQRVQGIDNECRALRRSFDSAAARRRDRLQRQELLASASSVRARGRHGAGSGDVAVDVESQRNAAEQEAEARAAGSVARSHAVLDEIFGQGAAVLTSLSSQRDRLKRAQRRMLDVLHAIGLSESLLIQAERRMKTDRAMVYAGIAIVTTVAGAAWWWLKA